MHSQQNIKMLFLCLIILLFYTVHATGSANYLNNSIQTFNVRTKTVMNTFLSVFMLVFVLRLCTSSCDCYCIWVLLFS